MTLKFRAYDADDKVMRSWEEIYFTKDIGSAFPMVGYKACPVSVKYDHKQILMQYTGLEDKNGVEIYEGDIIPSNYNVFSKGELNVQVVRFLGGGFRRLGVYQEWGPYGAYGEAEIADWHDGECLDEEEARKTKVLGNIYEHPHLLKELEENGKY